MTLQKPCAMPGGGALGPAARPLRRQSTRRPFSPDATSAGKRTLANAALALLTRLDGGAAAAAQYDRADNMTLQLAALSCLLDAGQGAEQLAAFEANGRMTGW